MFSTAGMARISARHPWRVIAAWTVLIVVAIAIAVTSLGDASPRNRTSPTGRN